MTTSWNHTFMSRRSEEAFPGLRTQRSRTCQAFWWMLTSWPNSFSTIENASLPWVWQKKVWQTIWQLSSIICRSKLKLIEFCTSQTNSKHLTTNFQQQPKLRNLVKKLSIVHHKRTRKPAKIKIPRWLARVKDCTANTPSAFAASGLFRTRRGSWYMPNSTKSTWRCSWKKQKT